MSTQPRPWPQVPAETARVAKAAFRRGSLAIRVRDQLGAWCGDEEFTAAYGRRGAPGTSPAQLAMVTVLQFVENLTDRQAADAVRGRVDWKYCLGLDLSDPGFDFTVLSEFRARLLAADLEARVFDTLLEALVRRGLLAGGGAARTDSTHVIAAVRDLNRLELAGESVRAAVEAIAVAAPAWLAGVIDVGDWAGRYPARIDSWRLPTSATKRAELAGAYGRDGHVLVAAVYDAGAPAWLRELPAVQSLRIVLVQNYLITVDARGRSVIRMREAEGDGLPPGRTRITSPYDGDARWAAKGDDLRWNGYKVHLTETCHPDVTDAERAGSQASGQSSRPVPNVITSVLSTDATVPDVSMTQAVHENLAGKGLAPGEHFMDSGYPSAALVLDSARQWGITLVSPLLADCSPQARAGAGYDRTSFTVDFEAKEVTCPQGKKSTSWTPATQRGTDVVVVRFAGATCLECPVRALCTSSKNPRVGRQLSVPPREVHQAQQAARAAQKTKDWQERYATRAGVEGTINQAVTVTDMRHARYRGLDKTRLQHLFAATGLNLVRLDAYWNARPSEKTRTSHLARLNLTLAA